MLCTDFMLGLIINRSWSRTRTQGFTFNNATTEPFGRLFLLLARWNKK